MEFKGTSTPLEKVYQNDVCVGIGTKIENGYFEMTANSVLPDCEDMSDEEIDDCMEIVEADMTLYAHSKEMLEMLIKIHKSAEALNLMGDINHKEIKELIKSATEVDNGN